MEVLNLAFYKFVNLENLEERKACLSDLCARLGIRGSMLLGPEGINGMVAGPVESMRELARALRSEPEFAGLPLKESYSNKIPFTRMRIRIKPEIITTGHPEIRPAEQAGDRLPPREFKKWIDEGRDMVILDTRNEYEIRIGTFRGAQNLGIKHFRHFYDRLKKAPEAIKDKPVVMFCTGGIRCEKATAMALREGFKSVYQLDGGILRYFEECGGAHFQGDCFVFDERNAVTPELKQAGDGQSCLFVPAHQGSSSPS